MTEFDPVPFLERAVRTPSHETVEAMREVLVETLSSHGREATVDDAGNILSTRGDTDGRPHVVLNTHVDTVPPHVPFDRDDGTIRGRGACDAKGPLAALLAAFLATDPGDGRLTLAVTPDEETRSTGAAALAESLSADAYVVGEPTGLDVCHAARGRFEATVTLVGENAHAAEPDKGVNAVAALRPTLDALATFDPAGSGLSPHPDLGAPTLTPTVVDGGETANQVPAKCELTVDRRSVPPETAEGFRESLERHLRANVADPVAVRVTLAQRGTPFLEAFETPADDPLVAALREASGGDVRPFTAATEASYFAADAPTVVFGPGDLADDEGPVAHADREYVRVDDVRAAAAAVETALSRLV